MKTLQNKSVVAIIIALILGISIIGYGFMDYKYKQDVLAQKEADKVSAELNEKRKQNQVKDCINAAETTYSENWDKECEGRGLEKDCSLPVYAAEAIEGNRNEMQENCFKLYK